MPHARINVPLDMSELEALIQIARSECRDPREQLRFLLRNEARRRGLLVLEEFVERQQVTNYAAPNI